MAVCPTSASPWSFTRAPAIALLRRSTALGLIVLLSACGGGATSGNGGVASAPNPPTASTPSPAPAPAPTPTPTPAPASNTASSFQTSEYLRSDGPEYHNAITAYTNGATGKGITIALIDSGIDSDSPEFAGRIHSASTDLAGNRGIEDEAGHGTQVALVAAGARNNSGVHGIAFDANLLVMRADSPGSCTTAGSDSGCSYPNAAIAAGIDRAVSNGARVINISLGGSAPTAAVRDAVVRAASAGVVVIVSAGNNGNTSDASINPANPDPLAAGLRAAGGQNVIIVGSVGDSGAFSSFSNRAGNEAQYFLSAQGERVCCVYENGTMKVTVRDGQNYVTLSNGTSFAAPQVAGAVALLAQAFPNLTGQQIVQLLLTTATDAGDTGVDAIYGRGILNIAEAFRPQGNSSLAGTSSPLPLGSNLATTSGPMGDAPITGASLGTVILDGFDRAFAVDLAAGIAAQPARPLLGAALTNQGRTVQGGNAAMQIAFSIRAHEDGQAIVERLRLSGRDAEASRLIATSLSARLGPATHIALGYRQSAEGLVAGLQGQDAPAFLVAGDAGGSLGLFQSHDAGFALRHRIDALGVTLSAGQGRIDQFEQSALLPDARIRQSETSYQAGVTLDRRWGGLMLTAGLMMLDERRTVLGARFHPSLASGGAQSVFADAAMAQDFGDGWRWSLAWRQGLTRAAHGGAVTSGAPLVTNAFSFDLSRRNALVGGDRLALRLSQPLRVASGSVNFLLPVDHDYASGTTSFGVRSLNLAPDGRELSGELAWSAPIGHGQLMASLFYRKDPGHIATMPDDMGAGLRYRADF